MADCLFCRIAGKAQDASIVYESEDVVGFRDINPGAPTHVLLIPKRHIASARDLGPDDAGLVAAIFDAARTIAAEEGLDGGYRVVTNVGGDAGQSVFHLHFHVLGGRQMGWPPG